MLYMASARKACGNGERLPAHTRCPNIGLVTRVPIPPAWMMLSRSNLPIASKVAKPSPPQPRMPASPCHGGASILLLACRRQPHSGTARMGLDPRACPLDVARLSGYNVGTCEFASCAGVDWSWWASWTSNPVAGS